jgi:hypothetical protein
VSWTCTRTQDLEDATTDEVHVHPCYELHTISPSCWCAPKRIDEIEVFPIYLHRDKLDREGPREPAFDEEDRRG